MLVLTRCLKHLISNLALSEHTILALLLASLLWPIVYKINWNDDLIIRVGDIIEDTNQSECQHNPTGSLPMCSLDFDNLVENYRIETQVNQTLFKSIASKHSVEAGGRHRPTTCVSRQKVALIIPFRNRHHHLEIFLQHIHPFLYNQLIDYTVFVIEQTEGKQFNRGKLFNIGFLETQSQNFCCYFFHDVDVLPQNQKQLYLCSKSPRHVCAYLDKFRYVLIYPELFGGAVSMTKSQFERINGFSNEYFGWGGEDDDIYNRIKNKKLKITRWEQKVSKCMMLSHKQAEKNPNRNRLVLEGTERSEKDGLKNLRGTYEVKAVTKELLYTKLLVDV